jgi:hypothetical protein
LIVGVQVLVFPVEVNAEFCRSVQVKLYGMRLQFERPCTLDIQLSLLVLYKQHQLRMSTSSGLGALNHQLPGSTREHACIHHVERWVLSGFTLTLQGTTGPNVNSYTSCYLVFGESYRSATPIPKTRPTKTNFLYRLLL